MKRIGMIHGDRNSGLMYQRGFIPLRRLRHKYDLVPMSLDDIRHADILTLDAIIMFHPYHAAHLQVVERTRAHYHIPVIVDLDDLLTHLPSDHPIYVAFQDNVVEPILSTANHLVLSTEYLKACFGHLNKNITVVENCIEERRYRGLTGEQQIKPYKTGFTVGWSGSDTHRPDLYNTGFIDGLIEFMDKYEDTKASFHVLCPQVLLDRFGSRIQFNPKTVDYMDWPSMCYSFAWDVCAVPLYNHPFNRAKSDLRLLDMAPFGIPLIASHSPSFSQHANRLQLTQNTKDAWFQAFESMYLDRPRRESLAQNAFDYVMSARTAEVGAEKWNRVLTQVLESNH